MPLHPDFPSSPYDILSPEVRWLPGEEEEHEDRANLMPPFVEKLRQEVKEFRDSGYVAALPTSKNLLKWWFNTPHPQPTEEDSAAMFRYYFAQREALETIIYLFDVAKVKNKHHLMPFDSSGDVSANMLPEDWLRYVIKMATGSGKTKVLSLVLAWSFFHKLYEPESELSRNFLVIAPNIIVLDRLYKDFNDLRIFHQDPVLPYNGFEEHDWRNDFELTLHRQDDVRAIRPTGNIFLTNIHRVYSGKDTPSLDDKNTMNYFLGKRPTGATTDSKIDLGMIVRDIDELAILNDEAHHIHDEKLAWYKSIEDIHKQLSDKGGKLSFQIDTTATPKHNDGRIFTQTVTDYPLVEAISQNIVKQPVLPDDASQRRLRRRQGEKITEIYADYIKLGVIEWRKAFKKHEEFGKKAILFVIADNTNSCNDIAEYLRTFDDFADDNSVLVIHTRVNGEITGASAGEVEVNLDTLREQANEIDSQKSPYKAIVSVLMLKEGWDVCNVTTIVGLRPFQRGSNILPEQTLGRGLRQMYPGNIEEHVSIIGMDNFIEFVKSIKTEGITLKRVAMNRRTTPAAPLAIKIDRSNRNKNINALDIVIPILTSRVYREYKYLEELDINAVPFEPIEYRQFSDKEEQEIGFKKMVGDEDSHSTKLHNETPDDCRDIINNYARSMNKELALVDGYAILYGKIKEFVRDKLFGRTVDLEAANTARNLEETPAEQAITDVFSKAVKALTVQAKGSVEIQRTIKLQETPQFPMQNQACITPKKSVFNLIIGDSQLELDFADFLEGCSDIVSYAKNYLKIGFKLDYVNANGDISNYFPDFIVKQTKKKIVIVETKGLKDVDVEPKMKRLKQWCADVNAAQSEVNFDFVFVDQESFKRYQPRSFADLASFTQYRDA